MGGGQTWDFEYAPQSLSLESGIQYMLSPLLSVMFLYYRDLDTTRSLWDNVNNELSMAK